MKTHEPKLKWALPSFQGWRSKWEQGMWRCSGWRLERTFSSSEPLLSQSADERFTWHLFDFIIKHIVTLDCTCPSTDDREWRNCVLCQMSVLLVSSLSFAGQHVCWLICTSCNKACCLYVNVQACVNASSVAPSKILDFGVCPSCCLLDLDLLLACVPILTFRHITCALLSRDGDQIPSLMLCLSF